MGEVPANIRRNVRAVLLSKAGGVLVSDFIKDYKALLKESLFVKDHGFDNMNDFFKAIPDVARLEYDDKCMAYRLYGIGDSSTYMSLSAKNAQKSKGGDSGRGRDRGSRGDNSDDKHNNLIANARGLYSLCFPRRNMDETEEDIREKFSVVGDLDDVNMIPKLVFVRFRSRDLAIKALEQFKSMNIRVAEEKNTRRPADKSPKRQENEESDNIICKKDKENSRFKAGESSGGRGNKVEIYIGNLNQKATQEDIEDLVSEFSPLGVRVKRMASDPRKVFAFVDFGAHYSDKAEQLVEKLNGTEWKGRNLQVRFAHETTRAREGGKMKKEQPSDNTQPKSVWPKSSSNKDSNNTSKTAVTSLDDDSWDNDQDTSDNMTNSAVSETPKTGGSIWATARSGDKASPLKSPILEQSYATDHSSQSSANLHNSVKSDSSSTNKQIPGGTSQAQPIVSQIFSRSPVKTEQDLLVESMTSFLKSPVKPEQTTTQVLPARSPLKTETGMQITIQNSPVGGHKRNLANAFEQLEINGNSSSPNHKHVLSPSGDTYKSRQIISSNDIDDDDEMPMLEPAVAEKMPALEPLTDTMPVLFPITSKVKNPRLFISNFPYGESDEALFDLFYNYGVVEIYVGNRNYTTKSTYAIITLESAEAAEQAIMDLNQTHYKGRRLLVTPAKDMQEQRQEKMGLLPTPHGNSPMEMSNHGTPYRSRPYHSGNFPRSYYQGHHMAEPYHTHAGSYPRENHQPRSYNTENHQSRSYHTGNHMSGSYDAVSPPGSYKSSIAKSSTPSPSSSSSSINDNKVAFKSWYAMLQTYKIVMSKLGGRAREMVYKPQEKLRVFVTSVYDDKNFWGQVIEDDSTLEKLETVMSALQLDEIRTGPTKGLGRCAAKFDNEWYRAWIISERGYNVDVFYVDYGNISTLPKNQTSLTCPDLWEHKPALRPFRLTEGSAIDMKPLESQLILLQVVQSSIEDTGYLMEVIITSGGSSRTYDTEDSLDD